MKPIAFLFACVAAVAAGADCGGGKLGGNAGASGALDGFAGATAPSGIAGAGNAVGVGIGGDGAPAPGGVGGNSGVGNSGVGGVFGSGGIAGFNMSGTGGFATCSPFSPPACGSLCGNGKIDSCRCPPYDLAEECDGDQFGNTNCVVRGYGSGSLRCSAACGIDDTGCSECLQKGGPLIDCRPAPIRFPDVGSFGIAATDTEIGLAQIDYNSDVSSARLTFTRLNSTLGMIGTVGLEDTTQAGSLRGYSIDGTAVAPTASGWVVAGCGNTEVFFHTLDSNGKKIARTVVASGFSVVGYGCTAAALSLVPQPGGKILLMWMENYASFSGALIAGDGLSVEPELSLFKDADVLADYPAAVWINDAFYVVAPVNITDASGYNTVLRVLRVAPDGTIAKLADVLRGESLFGAGLAKGASDLRLIYSGLPTGGFDSAVLWRRLGADGQPVAGSVPLASYPNFLGRAPAVAIGDDTVVLLNGFDTEQLGIIRVGIDGKVVKSRYDIALAPDYGLFFFDMVRRGPEVVVAWLRPSRQLTLARFTP